MNKQIEYDFQRLLPGQFVTLTGENLVYLKIKVVARKSTLGLTEIANIPIGLATMQIVNKTVLVDYLSPIDIKNLGALNGRVTFVGANNPTEYTDTYLYMQVTLGYQKN
jgi:hypothetical protein